MDQGTLTIAVVGCLEDAANNLVFCLAISRYSKRTATDKAFCYSSNRGINNRETPHPFGMLLSLPSREGNLSHASILYYCMILVVVMI